MNVLKCMILFGGKR